jgi:hypothetical protein
MLQLLRRHTKKCNEDQKKKAAKNPDLPEILSPKELRNCTCPFHLMGTDTAGKFRREALETADLTVASLRLHSLERGESY